MIYGGNKGKKKRIRKEEEASKRIKKKECDEIYDRRVARGTESHPNSSNASSNLEESRPTAPVRDRRRHPEPRLVLSTRSPSIITHQQPTTVTHTVIVCVTQTA